MQLDEWAAAAVEGATGASPPTAEVWRDVAVPGVAERFAGADCVAYRTRFSDPRSDGDTRAMLTLRGVYAAARVWLNGELLGTHDTYFAPARFLFEPAADNELVVECRPPGDRFGGAHDSDLVRPEDRVPGIWWGAEVAGVGPVAMTDFRVRPRLVDGDGVFETTIRVDATRDVDDRVTLSIRPEGFRGSGTMTRARVEAAAGQRVTVEHDVEVGEPSLWYPRGYGPQPRYVLTARFGGAELRRSTGFRTVERDDDGLRVNGREVRARGFNRLPVGDPEADVERAVAANATLVRAHAHVPAPAFHRACDAAGLLVFQDLPLTGEGGFDIDRGRELAGTLARRFGHHPSVAMYGVHDDPRDLYPTPVGSGRTGRYRLRWRGWRADYNDAPDDAVAEALPADVPSFPVVGPVGIDPDAATFYPGWDYGSATDVDWLVARDPARAAVVAEFGAGALGNGGVPDDAPGFNWAKHDAHAARDVEDSQAYQASVLKTVAEGLRRHGSQVMAAFALRDAGGAGFGVLDRDGTEKAGYAAVAASFEPVQAVLDGPPRGRVGTTVVNDTGEAVEADLAWSAGDESGDEAVSVDPLDAAAGPRIRVPGGAAAVELTLDLGGRTVENRYPL